MGLFGGGPQNHIRLKARVRSLLRDCCGQGLVEYLLIVALVALGALLRLSKPLPAGSPVRLSSLHISLSELLTATLRKSHLDNSSSAVRNVANTRGSSTR